MIGILNPTWARGEDFKYFEIFLFLATTLVLGSMTVTEEYISPEGNIFPSQLDNVSNQLSAEKNSISFLKKIKMFNKNMLMFNTQGKDEILV